MWYGHAMPCDGNRMIVAYTLPARLMTMPFYENINHVLTRAHWKSFGVEHAGGCGIEAMISKGIFAKEKARNTGDVTQRLGFL